MSIGLCILFGSIMAALILVIVGAWSFIGYEEPELTYEDFLTVNGEKDCLGSKVDFLQKFI